MNSAGKTILALAISILAWGSVDALASSDAGMAEGTMHHHPAARNEGMGGMAGMDMGARIQQHLEHFKSELKITGQQEPLWQAYADKVTADVEAMKKQHEEMSKGETLPAPEAMARMNAHLRDRLTAREAILESFKRLYERLTPEQKAVADKHFSRHGEHRMFSGAGQSGPGKMKEQK